MTLSYRTRSCFSAMSPCKRFAAQLLLGLILCAPAAFASNIPEIISFQKVLENKDISMGEGSMVYQDSDGFMWLGGGTALMRYDGYEFREVKIATSNSKDDPKPVNFVLSLFEDKDHLLWVGTRSGLLQYNSKTEKLIQIPSDPSQTLKLDAVRVHRMYQRSNGSLVLATTGGVVIFKPDTYQYTAFTPDATNPNALKNAKVTSLHAENDTTFWFGTEAGLEKLDLTTGQFSLHKLNPAQPDSIPENGVADVLSDGNGQLWVATATGLVRYNPNTQTATRYQNNPNDRYSLGGNDVWDLLRDSQGNLWIASDGGGLSVYNPEKNNFINHKFEAGRAASISSNAVRSIYEDKNGDIWTGNFPNGFNFFDRSSAAIVSYARDLSNPKSLGNNAINPIVEDAQGNLWLGIDGGGMDYFNRESGEFTHFKNDPNNVNSINGDSVLAICADSKGLIWTGVWGGGMASYNPKTQQFTRYPYEKLRLFDQRTATSKALNNAHVWSIREDKTGQYWVATFAGGLSRYNPETKEFTHYTFIEKDPESISNNFVWTTLEDTKGRLWVGAANGLNLMDNERTGRFTRFTPNANDPNALPGNNVLTLFEDSKGRLWVGTDGGLSLRDETTGKFENFTKKNGFINDTIRKIIEDANGMLWIGTDNGFASLNPETKAIKIYNRAGGKLIGAISNNSGALSKKGEVIFGGTNGLRIIKTHELAENKTPPLIALTDFKIFSDSITIGGEDGLLKNAINHTDKIVLDYKKSLFIFNFSSLNFRETEKNKYAYRLQGFDKSWVDAGSQRQAKYTNLDAGTYVFEVKGSNNDGVWSTESKTLTLVQLPPPWKTWWAYTLYACTLVGLVAWFLYNQRQKRKAVEEQNRLLELKVNERTAQLREKNKDIQAMLENMNQGLFTIQADGSIHPEYSHFLEDIYETTQVSGQNGVKFLFEHATAGSDVLDQIKEAIFSMVGEDELNYSLNSHILINEYEAVINDKTKCLALDWNPILADGIVTKLMVSVKDVTELKQMEIEARSKQRELDIVSQLLKVVAKKYKAFAASAKFFIQENREYIENNPHRSDTVIALLFRNMHTIKGNCRTFGFKYFSDVVHDVESVYSRLKQDPATDWDKDLLFSDLIRVENILQEYEDVFYNVLGRGEANRDENGFWADTKAIDIIQRCIDATKSEFAKYDSLKDQHTLDPIQSLLNTAMSTTMNELLGDIVGSLPSIAVQLGKEPPKVYIQDEGVRIKSSAGPLITNIFAHLLRNCMDHGIEAPVIRQQAGKTSFGSIVVHALIKEGRFRVSVQDDGQGVNIDRLYKKGIEVGQWAANATPSYQDIANLIFASGVSTKEQVTDISGRGVGMDAVKQFLIAQGGDITLEFVGPNAEGTAIGQGIMVPFVLVIDLPQDICAVPLA